MNTAWLLLNVTVCSGGKKLRRILRHGFFQLDLEFKIRNRQVCVTMFDPWEASWITALYIWCGRSLLKKKQDEERISISIRDVPGLRPGTKGE
jgi:hypothetical protein